MYFVFNVFIGFGVVATRKFQKGEFLLEYVGERINGNEAKIREQKGNCYIFGYKFNERFQWYVKIDFNCMLKFCIRNVYYKAAL